jgi:proteasome lid subunit RPN8/RPN11
LLRIGQLEGQGFAVAVIYHSHIDAGAYFSETDRRQALFGDEPMYPGVAYVVASVRGSATGPAVDDTAAFRWDAGRRDFASVELAVPAGTGGPQA